MVFESAEWFLNLPPWVIFSLTVWSLTWKGLALWKSARKNSPIWFVALLVINTFGLLEILYIFVFSKIVPKKLASKQNKRKKKR